MTKPRSAEEWAVRWYKDWIDSSPADAHPAIDSLTRDFRAYAAQETAWAWECEHIIRHIGENSFALCPDCTRAYAAALQAEAEELLRAQGWRDPQFVVELCAERDALQAEVEQLGSKWTIEYDENSVAWIVSEQDNSVRKPLEHGQALTIPDDESLALFVAVARAAATALTHLEQLGRSPTHSTPYVIRELHDALAHPTVQEWLKKEARDDAR